MKKLEFLASSYDDFLTFPREILRKAGYQLHLVQIGQMPTDFKTMFTIGIGVNEIRVKDKDGIYRVVYTAKITDCIYVLHAFQKKTQKTSKKDIELAKQHHKQLLQYLKEKEKDEKPNI